MNLTITKKVAQQGRNLVLIIPKNIHHLLKRGDLVEVKISTLPSEENRSP